MLTTAVPNYPPPSTNKWTQQLLASGTTPAIGAGIVLKVMSGDMVNVKVDCWYRTNNVALSPITAPGLGGIISLLTGSVPAASAGKFAAAQLTTSALTPDVNTFLN